ncbi:3',5'-cyclic-nucleotide phosphodiesterase [Parachitinimonas caeni]|uniref:3',5'-cyclic-nucleotide phosphodiesterase n=1 Tax=Parachitinimonas caeni TaxID=3031301 RepID=A0ABT7DW75_9NEIS|nr:3',5'-cyclic-nucleotide phosphodiesterase [Parachitinimonas caeni]MDK2122907.1 3',5'-cyclic-nucleotide phosphodiesterase [Parachitinimonas caeni]
MHVKVLGCSAGISEGLRTTSFKLGDHALLDCGTGVGDLSLPELLAIDTVFLTHSHLDHSGFLPFLADAHASHGGPGITVHALPYVTALLRQRLFDGPLWPDYTRQPEPDHPYIRFQALDFATAIPCGDGTVRALPAQHSVPAVGFLLEGPKAALAFSGDSGPCPAFWAAAAASPKLAHVIVENTFRNQQQTAAERSGHMIANWLPPLAAGIDRPYELWISHLEPGHEAALMAEVQALPLATPARPLQRGMMFVL